MGPTSSAMAEEANGKPRGPVPNMQCRRGIVNMAIMVDWEYYNSLYNAVDQATFSRLEKLAERQVKAIIGTYRWESIRPTAFYYDQLKDCICMLINKLASLEKSGVGTGLASVSNDGYTESYVIQTQPQVAEELRSCVTQWLSGTGLVGAYKC